MSKLIVPALTAAALALGAATTAQAQSQYQSQPQPYQSQPARPSNGITNCDAPGGRQQAGAVIGGVLGALVGSQISDNERALGAVAGGAAGAAAGSYIGCSQQRDRAAQGNSSYTYDQTGSNSSGYAQTSQYRATSALNIRQGPGTNYPIVGRLNSGQVFSSTGMQGDWVQISGGGWVSARYVSANY
jgi:Uncharacterized protein with a bacterial SH3 domain homologue